MYESFVASPTGATDPAAWDDIGLGKNDVGVQAVGPEVPGNGATAPLPMLIRQRINPISPTVARSTAKVSQQDRRPFWAAQRAMRLHLENFSHP